MYKYIFTQIYRFYIKVFKEKEIPHFFAAAIVAILMVSVYQIILDVFFLFTRNPFLETLGEQTKFISVGLVILSVFYVSKKKRYIEICAQVNSLNPKRKRLLAFVSILYFILTVVLFIYLGESIRDINMGH